MVGQELVNRQCLGSARRRRKPWCSDAVLFLRLHHANTDDPVFAGRSANNVLRPTSANPGDPRQERPLVGMRPEFIVEKQTVSIRPWLFLQRKSNQIPQSAPSAAYPD